MYDFIIIRVDKDNLETDQKLLFNNGIFWLNGDSTEKDRVHKYINNNYYFIYLNGLYTTQEYSINEFKKDKSISLKKYENVISFIRESKLDMIFKKIR